VKLWVGKQLKNSARMYVFLISSIKMPAIAGIDDIFLQKKSARIVVFCVSGCLNI
jgi:hypothetical protein